MDQILGELQKLSFKSVSWIYLKKNGDYENQVATAKEDFVWTPTKAAATMAKKTLFGDGVNRKRVILISLDKQLVGLYDVMTPILADEKVKLKMYLDLENKSCIIPKGSAAGSLLTKDQLVKLYVGSKEGK